MKLTVIGCSGSIPGPTSPASSYLVQSIDGGGKEWSLLLDTGNGSFGQLQKHIDPARINAVLISHTHPDHISDIANFYVYLKYGPAQRVAPIDIYGPAGIAERIIDIYGPGSETGLLDYFRFHEISEASRLRIGPFDIEFARMFHPVPTYGIALCVTKTGVEGQEHQHRLVYSADTDDCPEIRALAAEADLFLCEAAFLETQDSPEPGLHLTGRRAGEVAQAAEVGHLVLTHIPPWISHEQSRAEAASVYSGRISLATVGATFETKADE